MLGLRTEAKPESVMYRAHVEATFESAHRNGPDGHKCAGTLYGVPLSVRKKVEAFFDSTDLAEQMIAELSDEFDFHGHSWLAEIEWDYNESVMTDYLWGPDFGKVKDLIRQLDHHNLNLIFEYPSAEFLTKWLYEQFKEQFGFTPIFVKIHEGRGNTMVYSGE